MNRLWNAGDNLTPLRFEAEEMLRKFKGTQVSWIPRNWNKEADALVNKAFGPKTAPERSESKLKSKAKKPAWKDLPPAEMAAHLLATPTLADRTWTEEQRLTGEKRDEWHLSGTRTRFQRIRKPLGGSKRLRDRSSGCQPFRSTMLVSA